MSLLITPFPEIEMVVKCSPMNTEAHRNGKPCKSVNNSFPTACKRAGISDFHFHDLRHTFTSHLAMAGVDLITVKELLGHKTLTMTLRYAHLAPSHKVKAVNTLDKNNDVLHNYCTVEHGRL